MTAGANGHPLSPVRWAATALSRRAARPTRAAAMTARATWTSAAAWTTAVLVLAFVLLAHEDQNDRRDAEQNEQATDGDHHPEQPARTLVAGAPSATLVLLPCVLSDGVSDGPADVVAEAVALIGRHREASRERLAGDGGLGGRVRGDAVLRHLEDDVAGGDWLLLASGDLEGAVVVGSDVIPHVASRCPRCGPWRP